MSPQPAPFESRRLYRHIAEQVQRRISGGEFPSGSRLPAERELAEQLGVSRPSVREALIALEVEGVVEVRGGAGVFVRERKPARRGPRAARAPDGRGAAPLQPMAVPPGPFDVIRARWIVESEAAALAAAQATPQQLQRLKAALQQMQAARTHSAHATRADEDFHLCIAEASGNAALLMLVQQLWQVRTGPLYTQLESHFSGAAVWDQAVEEHSGLLDAIASRDPARARQAMRRHMRNAELRFASAWKATE